MKKKLFWISFHLLGYVYCFGQTGEWTWMRGDSTGNSHGHYGTQGVADPLNTPPALYEAGSWRDHQGKFWLFGGVNVNAIKYYSALWKYDPNTNEWTWVKGDTMANQSGVYGTKGIPAPDNLPGCRAFGFFTWVDAENNLWLFGGHGKASVGGKGMLGDLWRYNITSNEWTWMSGSDLINEPPIYGTLQIFDPANLPGGRHESTTCWPDSTDNFWLYGGDGEENWTEEFGDMWAYDPSINEWAWMHGANTFNHSPVYGTKGVFSPDNTPGGKRAYACWADNKNKFWMFAGSDRNDLWVFDPSIYQWAWMSGPDSLFSPGEAGNICDTSNAFIPHARYENKACWTDSCGHFWNFGGYDGSNLYSDLWVYDSDENVWAWTSGDLTVNSDGIFGLQGVSSPNNKSPGRMGAPAWRDSSGGMWMFGGMSGSFPNYIVRNDLWRFINDPLCPPLSSCNLLLPVSALMVSDTEICQKFCVDFNDQSTNNPTAWQWYFSGGAPASSVEQHPANICYNVPGTYDVTLITINSFGSDTLTLLDYITVYPTPPFPVITQSGYVLTSSTADSYQWQLNAVDIPGATNESYTVTESGEYTVLVTDSNGCVNSSSIEVVISQVSDAISDLRFSVYPNPSDGSFTVEIDPQIIYEVEVQNMLGESVFLSTHKDFYDTGILNIRLNAPSAIYVLMLKSEKTVIAKKLITVK